MSLAHGARKRPSIWSLSPSKQTLLLSLFLVLLHTTNAKHAHRMGDRHHMFSPNTLRIEPSETPFPISRREETGPIGLLSSASSSSGDYTCGPGKPCSNKACCGPDGWCGYEPKYCGTGCQSNCDAKAECGTYAATPGKKCPLNVCCSEFGFCGTTTDFCKKPGCQSNCDQPKPKGGKSDSQKRIIGYWEGWNSDKACGTMTPDEIPVSKLTHLIFSFGFITPGTFKITNMDGVPAKLFSEITKLKEKNKNLKVLIALGGWTFNDPGPWQPVFSDLSSTAANRATFIKNLMGFLSQYGFDGVDFDWEYPGADDRGGKQNDGVNFTKLLQDLNKEIKRKGKEYLVTFTAPTSYWYLRHFDIKATSLAVDWINLMSYDLHGVWDSSNPIGNRVLAHTNLTEIDLALDLLWRNEVKPEKVVLGMGFYGRSFKLSDPTCWKPGCRFSGPGDEGECTKSAGILSFKEITDIIQRTNAKPQYDKDAAVNYLVYGGNNWISYDNPKTFQKKIDFANDRGLSGLMIWAVDLDNDGQEGLDTLSPLAGNNADDPIALELTLDDSDSIAHSQLDSSKCHTTKCGEMCKPGFTPLTRAAVGEGKRCGKNNFRYVCCPSWTGLTPSDCAWRDQHSTRAKTDCNGHCEPGELKIAGDSFGWSGDISDGSPGFECKRGGKDYCCKAGNVDRIMKICTWTKCGGDCPSDKPFELTTDQGGPESEGGERCYSLEIGLVDRDLVGKGRKLCCPKKDSLKNCRWWHGKYCSQQCATNQITISTDPDYSPGNTCCCGREAVFCCDPPGGQDRGFVPVDLDRIFPNNLLPPPSSLPEWDLVQFGNLAGLGVELPNANGVGFFLIAGSETGVSTLRKRTGMYVVSCPSDLTHVSDETQQVMRVMCISGNIDECMHLTRGGVEGTVVHMPEDCGDGTYARAISLEPSTDQKLPGGRFKRGPSPVTIYDFTFDYNTKLVRRDSGDFSIRADYSNVPGYWNAAVDSEGKKKREFVPTTVATDDILQKRFFSGEFREWHKMFDTISFPTRTKGTNVGGDILRAIYYDGVSKCPLDNGASLAEGIAMGVVGKVDAYAFYGFSMVATFNGGNFKVHQSAGFIRADGNIDVTFKVAGTGIVDSKSYLKGSPIKVTTGAKSRGSHALFRGWIKFNPYLETGVTLSTNRAEFSGNMEARVDSEFGRVTVMYPEPKPRTPNLSERRDNKNSKGQDRKNKINVIADAKDARITTGFSARVGLKVDFTPDSRVYSGAFPDISIDHEASAMFNIRNTAGKDETCLTISSGTTIKSRLKDGSSVGWQNSYDADYLQELWEIGSKECFTGSSNVQRRAAAARATDFRVDEEANSDSSKDIALRKRQFGENDDLFQIPDINALLGDKRFGAMGGANGGVQIACKSCYECSENIKEPCCGCVNLRKSHGDGGRSAIVGDDDFAPDHFLVKKDFDGNLVERDLSSSSRKKTEICSEQVRTETYTSFPNLNRPNEPWIGVIPSQILAYYHNTSSSCSDWGIRRFNSHDVDTTGVRVHYETEHTFEMQTIGQFFDEWLRYGTIRGSTRSLANQHHKDCNWMRQYILRRMPPNVPTPPWGSQSLVQAVAGAMGSNRNPTRLTVFLKRPNALKGTLFTGKNLDLIKFISMADSEHQLMYVREVGEIFTYMNLPEVWAGFCAVFEEIHGHLQDFDTYYVQHGMGTNPNLAGLWREFVSARLKQVSRNAKTTLAQWRQNRKTGGLFLEARWFYVFAPSPLGWISYVSFTRNCGNNLLDLNINA